MSLDSGTHLGSYEIRAPISAGGMGEVYRAADKKLGREVALKILPAEMAQDPDRLSRFRREARAVAALNHPNVGTLYSVEECDGMHFLTMELVEGVSLDRPMASGGLPVKQIIEIAGALSEALAAAHEEGIMHRNLKPANVVVPHDGRVEVLDFGLAKDVGAELSTDATLTSDGRTQAGIVMGPAYMSPEQVSGRMLDHRTDIFSLGVVLQEMTTGRRPFEGTSSAELVSSILRNSPPLVTDVRADLPSDLARVIRRCLERSAPSRADGARCEQRVSAISHNCGPAPRLHPLQPREPWPRPTPVPREPKRDWRLPASGKRQISDELQRKVAGLRVQTAQVSAYGSAR